MVTFKSIIDSKGPSVIPEITVIITNVSRVIETKMGKYQIVGLMDHENQKMSLNLYDSNIGKVEFGDIYRITKVKKSLLKTGEFRLLTTKFTKFSTQTRKSRIFLKMCNLPKIK